MSLNAIVLQYSKPAMPIRKYDFVDKYSASCSTVPEANLHKSVTCHNVHADATSVFEGVGQQLVGAADHAALSSTTTTVTTTGPDMKCLSFTRGCV